MTAALLCSGQGGPLRGMFALLECAALAQPVFTAATSFLGADPRALVTKADDAALRCNRTSQILCVTRALAAAACLELNGPLVIAGYSVGEMAAWCIAGLWSIEETFRLTIIRAQMMDETDREGGGLGFIRGLNRKDVDILVEEHCCAVSIVNLGGLFVIGGARTDVAACCAQALAAGALKAGPLAVNVASHTPRLAAAVNPFETALLASETAGLAPGRILIGAGDAAVVESVEQGAPGLAMQLAQTVDWAGAMAAVLERGADRLLELGPGTGLSDMMHGTYPELSIRALDDFRTLAGARQWLRR